MKKIQNRGVGLLLTLALLLGLIPGTAWAGEAGPAITVSMTVFDQGVFAADREGKPMMGRNVTVTDRNGDGQCSLDEALLALHKAYAPNGAADYAGADGPYGFSVTRLWGSDTSAVGFYKNNTLTGAVNEEILDQGDAVTAFIYKDQVNWSDRYSYFTKSKMTVCQGTEFEMEMRYDQWGTSKPQSTAPLGIFEEDGSYCVPASMRGEHIVGDIYMATVATDNKGKAKLSFTQPGTYTLTAQFDSSNFTDYNNTPPQYYLVAPSCTVTVLTPEEYAVYQEKQQVLDLAGEALTWDAIKGGNTLSYGVTENLTIPSTLIVEGKQVTLSWSCSDVTGALSVSNFGGSWSAYVDRPAALDVSCTLTATLSFNGLTAETVFPITVKAEGVTADKESVVTYAQLLTGIAAGYASSSDPWVVLDMAAYRGQSVKTGDYPVLSSPTAVALAQAAIKDTVDTTALAGVDVTGPYAIYAIPLLSMAYRAAGVEGTAPGHSPAQTKIAMSAYLNNLANNFAGVDEIAPVLTALAPDYHKGDIALDSAVDKGLAALAAAQTGSGAFQYFGTANANTTALAVVALSALGVDAHTDSSFIKNNNSAMDGLFSFALADHTGFGYKGNVTHNALATEQGFRALVAYARLKQGGVAYNLYLQAKESVGVVSAPDITATPKPPAGGGEVKEVEISVSVMVPPEGGREGQYIYRQHKGLYTNLLGQDKSMTVSNRTAALSVTTDVLDGAGLTYNVSGGYFSRIGSLSEGDHGPNSGWQYLVNGQAPMESSASYTFDRNSTLVWYYTDDYTKEASAQDWGAQPIVPTAKVVETQDGSYSVTLPSDRQGSVLVCIEGVGQGQVVVIVNKDGTQRVITKSLVQDGTAYLLLDQDAVIKVVDGTAHFTDVAQGVWYAQAVDFVSSRGLFSGVGQGQFNGDGKLNRGMMVTVLYALEQAQAQPGESGFSDVAEDDWYACGVAWAKKLGLAAGDEQGRFNPQDPITREQLAVMLYQYAKQLGMEVDTQGNLTGYEDVTLVSPWATQAMSWAVSSGILTGGAQATLDPGGTATRAQAAVMLQQFVARLLQK